MQQRLSATFANPDGQWHVLHTKSRQEKAVADDLAALKVDFFLPTLRQTRYYGNRKALVDLPMFPGYVFLWGTLEQAYLADRTKRIAQIIKVVDQEKLDWELTNLHLALSKSAVLEPYPHLVKGVRVEVRSGPFRGLQGIIEDKINPHRLILQVGLLGRGVSLEIDASLLDVVE